MKEEIQQLIQQHIEARMELNGLLEELSKVDDSKLSKAEKNALNKAILINEMENGMRLVFLNQLESLLL